MVLFFYNIIQLAMLFFLWPVLLVVIFCVPKYRGRIGGRLGFGLPKVQAQLKQKKVWIHALSVGESASARSLIMALKKTSPDLFIIFSTTTQGGEQFAQSFDDCIDYRVPFPLDIYWVVRKFIHRIRPDFFILTETDFWPNFLTQLASHKIPAILVNGRIAAESVHRYRKVRCLFNPVFDSFQLLFTQTKNDADNFVGLGAKPEKVHAGGNLKYDIDRPDDKEKFLFKNLEEELCLPQQKRIYIAGSTHPGEEQIVLRVFKKLYEDHPNIFLVIAPRDVSRGEEIAALVRRKGFNVRVRSQKHSHSNSHAEVLVLDSLGELSTLYLFADLVFVGGSLVDEGGHNPLEPACCGKPVLTGPSLSDFQEIADDLQKGGALFIVQNESDLSSKSHEILSNPGLAKQMGESGICLVGRHQGASHRIAGAIMSILT